MAIGITKVAKLSMGNARGVVVDIALDATYAAGGYALAGSDVGLSNIAYFHGYFRTGENLVPNYSHTAGKLEIWKGASTVTVTTGSAAFSECATNDTLVAATTIVRALLIEAPANVG